VLLNDLDILKRLVDPDPTKRIVVTPLADPIAQIGPSSLDIRLGAGFKVPVSSQTPAINPYKEPQSAARYMREVDVDNRQPFYLHPGEFALASTLEYIHVPYDLGCRLEGRSSWGRLGLLVHATAGFIDPGYSGNVTFELFNAGRLPIELKPGFRMAQLCFMTLSDVPGIPYDKRPESKYHQMLTAEGSRIWKDR
jgi:dCTP deaminase